MVSTKRNRVSKSLEKKYHLYICNICRRYNKDITKLGFSKNIENRIKLRDTHVA